MIGFLYNKKARKYLLYFGFFLFFGVSAVTFSRFALAQSSADYKSQLKDQLQQIQAQIDSYKGQIKQNQTEQKSLKREVALFDAQIAKIQLEIQAVTLSIQDVGLDIKSKNDEIDALTDKITKQKDLMAQYLQALYESDDQSTLEIILKTEKFSDFFDEVNSMEVIESKIKDSLGQLRELKDTVQAEKNVLEDKKDELGQLKGLQESQRASLKDSKTQKSNLLSATKGQEKAFQILMDRSAKDAASIRSQLYILEGTGVSMSLEKAYEYAKYASDKTGVRPAFLLAILKKETSWGGNVGTGTWKKDMNPNQYQAFRDVTNKLGLNPDTTPVSRKPSYGWGGAMGPAQFLPATWLSYEDKIAQVTGHTPPNPWHIDDAFVGAGIKLANNGAAARTPGAEWKAAMIYFAGKNWSNPVYRFYGDQVMDLAQVIQGQLDIIGAK